MPTLIQQYEEDKDILDDDNEPPPLLRWRDDPDSNSDDDSDEEGETQQVALPQRQTGVINRNSLSMLGELADLVSAVSPYADLSDGSNEQSGGPQRNISSPTRGDSEDKRGSPKTSASAATPKQMPTQSRSRPA